MPRSALQLHYSPYLAMPSPSTPSAMDVLLVEDNPSDESMTRDALDATSIPYSLKVLNKGNEVVPHLIHASFDLQSSKPDVILLDLGLPCTDGFEVLAKLSELPATLRDVPIIILTGYKDFDYIRDNMRLCICGYLHKPCSPSRLRKLLQSLHKPHSLCIQP